MNSNATSIFPQAFLLSQTGSWPEALKTIFLSFHPPNLSSLLPPLSPVCLSSQRDTQGQAQGAIKGRFVFG